MSQIKVGFSLEPYNVIEALSTDYSQPAREEKAYKKQCLTSELEIFFVLWICLRDTVL